MDTAVLDLTGLQSLVEALLARGYTVLGPTVRDGVIVGAEITGVDDLPAGWGDQQEPGRYRLRRRDDGALFGFASGAQLTKPALFPPSVLLWRRSRTDGGFAVEPGAPEDGPAPDGPAPDGPAPPYALLGVRSCDLHAIDVHDRVLGGGRVAVDAEYARRRHGLFLVAVTCSDPGGTCFCTSMGGGPRPTGGYDLLLTELHDGGEHRFLVESGSQPGADVLAHLPSRPAAVADLSAAERVTAVATDRVVRTLDTDGLRDVLYRATASPIWDEVADRCLACANCTLMCPTCFCTAVDDRTDLTGTTTQRHRIWDSCFSAAFSGVHGRSVRASVASRYRQWMTHKFAAWADQFGTSGCVGCGRCITWCPAGIDVTALAAALRAGRGDGRPGRDTRPAEDAS